MNMRHSILVMASILTLFSGCSKEESGTNLSDNGEKYVLDFTAGGVAKTRAAAGSENLMTRSNIGVSVFARPLPADKASKFINSPYQVTPENGLTYRNDLKLSGKQAIIEVSPGDYSIYGAGINDASSEVTLALNTADESLSTYATENGYEYLFGKNEAVTVTAAAASRSVKLSFERQVAKVVFSLAAGSGVTLPTGEVVKSPLMQLPKRASAAEGLLNVTTGITVPLTLLDTNLSGIYSNGAGAPLGFSYFVLPLEMPIRTTYDVQFKLKVDDGTGVATERTFDVRNIELPTFGSKWGFEKGKQYSYTISISNTGLYISEVDVKNWADVPQPPLVAQ